MTIGVPDLELEDVSHSFRDRRALSGVSFSVSAGVVGLLGPNGAGKSTLLNIIATTLPPQSGSVRVAGHDLRSRPARESARREIGYLPQRFSVMGSASCLRNVTYAAWAQGVAPGECEDRAVAALEVVGLADLKDKRARTLSGGQRQRLGIACATAHEPRVLLLDEPTVGLDPVQRAEIRAHLRATAQDRTVVISSHIVEDLERTADRLLVLREGLVVFDGTVRDLVDRAGPTGDGTLESSYIELMTDPHRDGSTRP